MSVKCILHGQQDDTKFDKAGGAISGRVNFDELRVNENFTLGSTNPKGLNGRTMALYGFSGLVDSNGLYSDAQNGLAIISPDHKDVALAIETKDQNFKTGTMVINSNIDMQECSISNVKDPTDDADAATKKYVDEHTPSAMIYEGLPTKPDTPIADGEEIPYTWEEINKITLAGKAQEYFSLGSTKLVNLSTSVLGANAATMMIIGFNQDGENTTTFQTKGVLPNSTVFDSSNAQWIDSIARTQCQNFYNYCDAKDYIKIVSKGTCPDQVPDKNGTAVYNDETVWLPSETEMGLDDYSSLIKSNSTTFNSECTKGYNEAYSYYTSNNARVKYVMKANGSVGTSTAVYWERSRFYDDSIGVCYVGSDGSANGRYYYYGLNYAPAFVIGNGFSSEGIFQDGKDITSNVKELIGGGGALYTATIGTTWSESPTTGIKYQEVAISGIKSTDDAQIDHVFTGSDTSDDYKTFVEAENQYLTYITNGYAETIDGAVKFVIFGDAPTVEIPIAVKVV